MRKRICVQIVFCASAFTAGAQNRSNEYAIGVSATYAPTSSHILIGEAEQRRVWTAGVTFDRVLISRKGISFEYAATLNPLFAERDPTIIASTTTIGGSTITLPVTPQRVIFVNQNPIGTANGGGGSVPIYPVYGSTETFAFSCSPLGIRFRTRRSKRFQPIFGADFGMVYSSRDLPVDDSSRFNYLFSFGPGVEFFPTRNKSIRLEYVYRHMSNANSGNNNPGVDSGVFRLTASHWGH